jgi:hypothetical protein
MDDGPDHNTSQIFIASYGTKSDSWPYTCLPTERRFVICETSYSSQHLPDGFECVHYRVRSISPLEYAVIFSTISFSSWLWDSVLQQFFRDFVPKKRVLKSSREPARGRAFHRVGWRSRIPYRKPRTHRLRTLHYPHVDPHGKPRLERRYYHL